MSIFSIIFLVLGLISFGMVIYFSLRGDIDKVFIFIVFTMMLLLISYMDYAESFNYTQIQQIERMK